MEPNTNCSEDQMINSTPDAETTVELVTSLQKGEPAAADAIYEAFHNDVYFFLLKSVKDPQLASNLTQDTFKEIYENIGSLPVPSAFLPWCKKIAQQRYTVHIKKRRDLLLDDKKTDYALMTSHNELDFEFFPDENIDSDDLRQTICDMIDALPEKLRTAIIMRYYDELSIKDIAKIQKTSEKTVTDRLTEGRSAIERSIEAFEKKHNIKFDNTGIIPIILWFFREDRLKNGISLTEMTPAAKEALANLLKNAPKIIVKKIAIRVASALVVTIVTGIFVHFFPKEPATTMPPTSETHSDEIVNKEEYIDVFETNTSESLSETTSVAEATVTTSDGLLLTLSEDGSYYIANLSNSQVEHLVIPTEYKGIKITTLEASVLTYNHQQSITLSENITCFLPYALASCTSLTDIYYSGTMQQWYSIEKHSDWGDGKENFYFIHCSDGDIDRKPSEGLEYTLSSDGTYYTLSNSANCKEKYWVIVADEIDGIPVTAIGKNAFYDCCTITGVELPDSILSIGANAFCSAALISIDIPDNVEFIGEDAFFGCEELTTLVLPRSVITIEPNIIGACDKLRSLSIEEGNPVYHSSGNCIIETASKTMIAGCSASIIPSDGSVTSISPQAIFGNDSLTHITIPEGITHIGGNAFGCCYKLTSVTLPSSLTHISNAFEQCSLLTDIYYTGTMEQWNSFTKTDGWAPQHGHYTIHCTDGDIAN